MPSVFTFPPPPPPPPSVSSGSNAAGYPSQNGGDQRPSRGRGRGGGSRSYRGHGSRYTADWDRPVLHNSRPPRRENPDTSSQASHHGIHKRSYGQAFTPKHRNVPLGKAPPAVPSFGSPLPTTSTLVSKDTSTASPKPKKDRTFNQLGLTPRKEEHESSEEDGDEDEEAKLGAVSQHLGRDGVQFEHKGQLMTLRTPEEIQAWIAERKKRYPTKSKVAEALAAKSKLNEQKGSDPRTGLQGKKQWPSSSGKTDKIGDIHSRSTRPNSKRHGDSQLNTKRKVIHSNVQSLYREKGKGADINAQDPEDSRLELPSGSEDTSSSGVSEATEDSDDSPLEQSAKIPVAALPLAPKIAQRPPMSELACPRFQKTGRCRMRGCSYQHGNPHRSSKPASSGISTGKQSSSRVPLYEKLLSQQNDEEDREILHCIIAMGERGLLEASS